jgi:cholinesterase
MPAGVSLSQILSTPGLYSEDCLYVNVWTKPQTGDAKKAVLLWIYGGGFNIGSSAIPEYVGANIAELEDVVVVSFKWVFFLDLAYPVYVLMKTAIG